LGVHQIHGLPLGPAAVEVDQDQLVDDPLLK